MLEKKIAKYIDNEHLLSKEDKVIIALSGGADSVALLHVMHSLGYKCEAAHCNFHLRGKSQTGMKLSFMNYVNPCKYLYTSFISKPKNMPLKTKYPLKWLPGSFVINGSKK